MRRSRLRRFLRMLIWSESEREEGRATNWIFSWDLGVYSFSFFFFSPCLS